MALAETLVSGSKTIQVENTAEQITVNSQVTTGVLVRAKETNVQNLRIGPSAVSASSYQLEPGESLEFDMVDLSRVYVFGAVNDKVEFVGLAP